MLSVIKNKKFEELTDIDLDYLYNKVEQKVGDNIIKGLSVSQIADMYGVTKDKARRKLSSLNVYKDNPITDTIAQITNCLAKAIWMLYKSGNSYDTIEQSIELDKLPEECRNIIKRMVK